LAGHVIYFVAIHRPIAHEYQRAKSLSSGKVMRRLIHNEDFRPHLQSPLAIA
jgi:hypothetical protein